MMRMATYVLCNFRVLRLQLKIFPFDLSLNWADKRARGTNLGRCFYACKWRGLRRQPTGQTGAASLHKPAERPTFLNRFMQLNPHEPAAPLQPAYSQVATLAACLASLWVGHARALTCGADDPFIVLSSLSECSESPWLTSQSGA